MEKNQKHRVNILRDLFGIHYCNIFSDLIYMTYSVGVMLFSNLTI